MTAAQRESAMQILHSALDESATFLDQLTDQYNQFRTTLKSDIEGFNSINRLKTRDMDAKGRVLQPEARLKTLITDFEETQSRLESASSSEPELHSSVDVFPHQGHSMTCPTAPSTFRPMETSEKPRDSSVIFRDRNPTQFRWWIVDI
jgi:hypothetical protein